MAGHKPQLIALNHIALEVGEIEQALRFYGAIFAFDLRGNPQRGRWHDRSSVHKLAEAAGATILDTGFFDFLDPWGNRVEVVEYRELQFSKTDGVLRGMGLHLDKTREAQDEVRTKGMPG